MNHRTIHLQGLPKGSKVYIAGPMSILKEQCYNFERFFYWASILRASGYIPLNPAEMECRKMLEGWVYDDSKYEEVIDADLKVIEDEADGIFNLNRWEESPGAMRENEKAHDKGIPSFNEVDYKSL